VFGLDEQIAHLGAGGGFVTIAIVAVLLGLRHATDPDHLVAVTALIAGDDARGSRRAGRLGLAWGAGHATTLTLLGIPIVVLDAYLPEPVRVAAEVLVGLVIMGLALRLVVRWRRAGFHTHEHRHAGAPHVHLHVHPDRSAGHGHEHHHGQTQARPADARSVRGSYAVGLVHGVGGSAGIGLLLLAAIPDGATGLVALVLFAAFTAVSMCAASTLFGRALAGQRVRSRLRVATPAMGAFNLAFGAWYALGALGVVPYLF
jgi:ABC-type nickel/cobalt efflux system permease component RcnA